MTPAPVLLLAPFLVAFAVWASAQSFADRQIARLRFPMQMVLTLVLARVLWAAPCTAWQVGAAVVVWLGAGVCFWWTRLPSQGEPSAHVDAGLFGLQGAAWLCVLAPTAAGVITGFCAAGVCLTVFSDVRGAGSDRVFRFHRLADALGIASLLVWLLWTSDLTVAHIRSAQASDDALLSRIAGFAAATWLLGLLCAALAFRAAAAVFACGPVRARWLATVVALGASTFGFGRLFAPAQVAPLILACAVGVVCAFALSRSRVVGVVGARLYRGLRLCGAFIAGINQWVLSTVLLQAPVVFVDACARVLKLLAGGDIQRYVAIGVAGLAALVFMTTRPAAPSTLQIEADGLIIRAAAARGPLSSSRLLYDYDFDGDEQFDRVGVGPHAAFVYAVPGTYSVSVTIRDPFWHTSRTLRAKVTVKR
ncbi:MAG: hypothetical protein SF187_16695 [Deltaproteobacteria bacterium]|nr:hypothetical protein [Deltaproteobacteria bacterium]